MSRDLTGMKVGKLTVIEKTGMRKSGYIVYRCRCSCGNMTELPSYVLTRKHPTKSCGCGLHDSRNKKHGLSDRPGYDSYKSMILRCTDRNNQDYLLYGGRGIKVCERWMESPKNFFDDMGDKPAGKTLDRIDVNGDYCPENCRWATWTEQQNNKRNNFIIDVHGKKMTLSMASREYHIHPTTLIYRIKQGWPIDLALTMTPRISNSVTRKHTLRQLHSGNLINDDDFTRFKQK